MFNLMCSSTPTIWTRSVLQQENGETYKFDKSIFQTEPYTQVFGRLWKLSNLKNHHIIHASSDVKSLCVTVIKETQNDRREKKPNKGQCSTGSQN